MGVTPVVGSPSGWFRHGGCVWCERQKRIEVDPQGLIVGELSSFGVEACRVAEDLIDVGGQWNRLSLSSL